MTQITYKQPPITEAVIGINFANPIDSVAIAKVHERFATQYPQHQDIQNLSLKVAVDVGADKKKKATTAIDEEVGHRRSTSDMSQILVILPTAILVSQLAPYPGWDDFFKRFVRDWKVWKRVVGYQQISRIGVRYINRIDIPVSGPIVEYEQFLNVYPKMPDILSPVLAYGVQTVSLIQDIGCKLTLNSAAVPSPILDHASFVLDQDIAMEFEPPQKDTALFKLLQEIRLKKNMVFEACISDRARQELFKYDL